MGCGSADNDRQDQNDDYLMQAAAHGDGSAFDLLLQRHRGWVFRLMCAVVQDAEQAEDLTQDAFFRVYRHLPDYAGEGQFIPWLKRIAVNLARNALRDSRARQENQQKVSEAAESAPSLEGQELDPARILTSQLLQDDVLAVLGQLSPEQRDTLLLYYISGFSIPEIARRLHCPEGTVKSRLHHARQNMRHYFEKSLIETASINDKGMNPNER